jgi:hypothetical protein
MLHFGFSSVPMSYFVGIFPPGEVGFFPGPRKPERIVKTRGNKNLKTIKEE